MGSKALGLCQPVAERPSAPESELPACPPDVAARVLAALLPQPVAADEVLARAVGLGLLRQPPPGEPARLTPLALARLFLAGYRVPAHVEAGSLPVLRNHLLAGRFVFVLLDNQGLELLRVQGGADGPGLLV